jgi:hypothetical protein
MTRIPERKPDNFPPSQGPELPTTAFSSSSYEEPDDFSDLDEIDPDDERWEAFLADIDESDPQPEHGDFWTDN